MEAVIPFIAPAILGLFIGVFSGMLGIGGGTIMVPAFRLMFGMSALMSTATSLFAIIPTSIAGAISHIRQGTIHPKLGLVLGLSGACTSPLGVWLASFSPSWAVMLVAAGVIGYSAISMLVKAVKMGKGSKGSKDSKGSKGLKGAKVVKDPIGSQEAEASKPAEEKNKKLSRKALMIGAAIGLAAGLISGYVGVGGGFIMVPLMVSLLSVPMKRASGTSLVAIMILAIPAVIEQAMMGNIDYLAGAAVTIGAIPGAVIGTKLLQIIPERTLRFIFGGFLIIAAILLALNEFQMLG